MQSVFVTNSSTLNEAIQHYSAALAGNQTFLCSQYKVTAKWAQPDTDPHYYASIFTLYMKNTNGVILGDIVPMRCHQSSVYCYNSTGPISSTLCIREGCNEENVATYSRHVRCVVTLLTHETGTAVHTLQLTVSMGRIPWFDSRQCSYFSQQLRLTIVSVAPPITLCEHVTTG